MKFRIDNLPNHTTEQAIRQLFSGYGNVLSVTLHPGPRHGKQLVTGLIELEDTKIRDVGLPDLCLFRGKVLRITQDLGSTANQNAERPAMPSDPTESGPRRPDNHSKNVLHVTSVDEVFDTTTGEPNGWCRYSIKSLAGSITGLRNGSVAEVKLYAEQTAEAFNLRNMLGQRRSPNWTSRHKK